MAESQDEYAANLELYEKVVTAIPKVKRKGKAIARFDGLRCWD